MTPTEEEAEARGLRMGIWMGAFAAGAGLAAVLIVRAALGLL